MADISTELHDIEQAKYGREVRGSIYTALKKLCDQIDTGFVTQSKLNSTDDLNTLYSAGKWWYVSSSDGVPQHWPYEAGEYGVLLVFGGATSAPITKAQIVITNHSHMTYRIGLSTSAWSEWCNVPDDTDLIVSDQNLVTASRMEQEGWTTYHDLPVNHIYGIAPSVGAGFDLPLGESGANMMVIRPREASNQTFYVCAQSQRLFYRSQGTIDTGWQEIPKLNANEELFKLNTSIVTQSVATQNGWRTIYDLPVNYSYRLSKDLDDFGLPVPNVSGASAWVWKTAGYYGTAGNPATFYFVAMSEEIYYSRKSGSSVSPWKRMTGGGGGGSDLPTRTYVAFGASTVDPDTAGKKYPFYVGEMGNYTVVNLAVGGTDFISRTNGYDNVMDLLTNSSNAEDLSNADLITVNIGANDYTMYVKSRFAANPDYEHTYIGNPDDYYEYDKTNRPSEATLRDDCTKAGAANYIIKYCAENFPKAQLMFIISPPSVGMTRHATVIDARTYTLTTADNVTTETLTTEKKVKVQTFYTSGSDSDYSTNRDTAMLFYDNPHDKGWYQRNGAKSYALTADTKPVRDKRYYTRSGTSPNYTYTEVVDIEYGKNYCEIVKDVMQEVCSKAKIPLIDCTDTFTSAFYNAATDREEPSKYRDDRADHAGVHPTAQAYEQYGKAVAAAILAAYRN